MAYAIQARNLAKRFWVETEQEHGMRAWRGRARRKPFWPLRGVTFDVPAGQSLGIHGPNGAGKSTLLKVLAGTLAPTEGDLLVNGRIAPLLALGAGFAPRLTGKENALLACSLYGMPIATAKSILPGIMRWADLEAFTHAPVAHYSSGMAARLGFSISIHLEADILLLDEVLAVGDEAFRQKCRAKLDERRQSGATILLVSHDREQIQSFCSRSILIEKGRIVADTPLDQAPG